MNGTESSKHGLLIGYNGSFLYDSTKKKCGKIGVIMTRGGRVFVRDSKHDPWDDVSTPMIFFFHDNETEKTYLVDKNKKSIDQTELSGRILNCTDQTIYEVNNCDWTPIYDLSTKSKKTIVRCSRLSAGPISSRQVGLEKSKDHETITLTSLLECDQTIPFDVLGCNAKILSELSEIDPGFVDLCNGFLSVDSILPGECATLIYETCICDEKMIVAHLFIRDPTNPRFSVKYGQFVPLISPEPAVIPTPLPDPLCPDLDPCLIPIVSVDGVATNLFQLQNWATSYQVPEGQFSSSGIWTIPRTGDYNIAAEIHLYSPLSSASIDRESISRQLPYFILVRFGAGSITTAPGVIEVCAPIVLNNGPSTISSNFFEDRFESAHASIDVGLRLNAGDTLVLYYVDNPVTPTLAPLEGSQDRGYRTIRCATIFNAHFLGCSM